MSTKLGQLGEDRACRYLLRRGLNIIGRNVRLGRGELDIIAHSETELIFIEVKSHKSRESGLLALHDEKCARIYSAAESWLASHPQYSGLQCRFDLIIVTPRVGLPDWVPPHIEHMKDIIRQG